MSGNTPWKAPASPAAGRPPIRIPSPPPAPGAIGRSRADALGTSALIVGIIAFLCGWMPVLGLIVGAAGVVLSQFAKRRSNRRNLGRVALILSLCAVVVNIGINIYVIMSFVQAANNL